MFFLYLGNSFENTLSCLTADLMDGCFGGQLHLIDRLGGAAAISGLLNDEAAAPFLLGQFLFQLGRHNPVGPLLDWLVVLALALIFDFVAVSTFFYYSYSYSYNITSKKIAGAPRCGVCPNKLLIQNLVDSYHDVVNAK